MIKGLTLLPIIREFFVALLKLVKLVRSKLAYLVEGLAVWGTLCIFLVIGCLVCVIRWQLVSCLLHRWQYSMCTFCIGRKSRTAQRVPTTLAEVEQANQAGSPGWIE